MSNLIFISMKKFFTIVLLLSTFINVGAQESEVVVGTKLGYGETFTFYPTQDKQTDSVYVDWGDGIRKGKLVDPNSWGENREVSGKLLGDTIRIYCKLKKIELTNQKVFSLSFIKQDSLTNLVADKNKLTNEGLDLSGAPGLKYLELSDNNMTNLNLSAFGKLEFFFINNNPQFNTAIFVDGNKNMKQISMDNCDIAHFYPVSLPNLLNLSIVNGSLMDIELGENYPKLMTLNLSGNKYLEAVDLTKSLDLYTLSLDNTAITEINISQNKELNSINVDNTKIKKLMVQNCKSISCIYAKKTLIESLDVSGLEHIQDINVDSTSVSRIDLAGKLWVRNISARATGIEFLDMHDGIGYNTVKKVDIRDCKNMTAQTMNFTFSALPFHKGSSYGKTLLISGSNGEHANEDLVPFDDSNYYTLDISPDGTASMDSVQITLQGVEGGSCKLNQENPASSEQPFAFFPIASKAVPGYPIQVIAKPNEGYVYDGVEVNGKLYKDTIFVVSAAATIKPIFKKKVVDSIIKLTVPSGVAQQYFLAADAPDTEIKVDWGDGAPVSYTLKTTPTFIGTDTGTSGTTVTIKGNVTYADFSSYPGYGTDNQITGLDITANRNLRTLKTYMNEITTLDVTNEADLEDLDCSYCELDNLDVTHNTKLTELLVYGNYLETLDITHAADLVKFDAKGNGLSDIDLSSNKKLRYLSLQNNVIKSLNVTSMKDLEELYAQGNSITSIDLSKNVNLYDLNLSNNAITSIDLSNNTHLESLYVDGNNLDALDLSKQKTINMVNVANNGWDACTLNDFYYSLPEYVAPKKTTSSELQTRLWVSSSETKNANDASHAESILATGKGWIINEKGDGTGCTKAFITILPYKNGTVRVKDASGNEVHSGDKVDKNTAITIIATPANGYAVESIKANGVNTNGGMFTLTASTDVSVTFTLATIINSVNNDINVKAGKGYIVIGSNNNVAIYTVSGKLIFEGIVAKDKVISLPAGLYIVKVGNTTVKSFVK